MRSREHGQELQIVCGSSMQDHFAFDLRISKMTQVVEGMNEAFI